MPGKKTVRFCADIVSARGLAGQRLQVVLSNVHPENDPQSLAGLAIWTWDTKLPSPPPLPGQQICLTRPILPVHAFRNEAPAIMDIKSYAQNIFWRVWSNGDAGMPQISGEPQPGARIRWQMEKRLLGLLDLQEDSDNPKNRARAVIPALLFGDRYFLSQDVTDKFAKAAIAHSLALSGQHLAVAGLIGYLCITAIAHFWPNFYLWRPKTVLAGFFACPFAIFYLWLGNAPPSLMRASCMLFIFCGALALAKNCTARDAVALAFCILLLLNPCCVFDTGLQLSFLCVLVLAAFTPFLHKNWFAGGKSGRFLMSIAEILLLSVIIQAALLPLTLKTFGIAGMWFPVNAFWLPLLGFITLPCSFAGLLAAIIPGDAASWLAAKLLAAACYPVEWLLFLLDWLHAGNFLDEPLFLRPHWSAIFAYALIFAALACILEGAAKCLAMRRIPKQNLPAGLLLPGPDNKHDSGMIDTLSPGPGAGSAKNGIAAGMLCLGLLFLAVGPLLRLERLLDKMPSLDVLDVGQGEAVLLNMGNGARILIDGGGNSSSRFDPGKNLVSPFLTGNSPPDLTLLVNSHPDMDHLGGLIYIAENYKYAGIFHNGREAEGRLRKKWKDLRHAQAGGALAAGDVIRFKGSDLYLEILSPPENSAALSSNNASLVLRLCDNGRGLALIAGDAEIESLKNIAASGRDISAEILVAPHHGSNSSFFPKFLEAVSPQTVIASCGFRNRYFYPGKKLTEWAQKNGVQLLDTGEYGRIRASFPQNGKAGVDCWQQGIFNVKMLQQNENITALSVVNRNIKRKLRF